MPQVLVFAATSSPRVVGVYSTMTNAIAAGREYLVYTPEATAETMYIYDRLIDVGSTATPWTLSDARLFHDVGRTI